MSCVTGMDVLSTPIFLVSMIWQKQLKEKKAFISLLGLSILYLMVRKACGRNMRWLVTSHRKQNQERGMSTGAQLAFSFSLFIQRETPAHGMEPPTFRVGLPTFVKSLKTPSGSQPEVHVLGASKLSVGV